MLGDVLRDATPEDLDEIAALITELAIYEKLEHEAVATKDDLRRWLFGPEAFVRVTITDITTDGGEPAVAGMALWFPTFSTFLGRPGIWLEDLYVRPECRGTGRGRALLEDLFEKAAELGGRVEWAVLDWNQPSIDFYDSLGARPVEGWTRYRWTEPVPGQA